MRIADIRVIGSCQAAAIQKEGNQHMGIILLVLLLALILGGLGFAVHVLWWIALIVLVIWLIGFVVRVGEGGSRGRWYRWLPARHR
jgi:membrane protein YdbS with pleckstrin-like domain